MNEQKKHVWIGLFEFIYWHKYLQDYLEKLMKSANIIYGKQLIFIFWNRNNLHLIKLLIQSRLLFMHDRITS